VGATLRIFVILAAAVLSLASFGPGDPDPEPDRCNSPEVGSIDSVEVGERDEDTFVSLADGSVVDFIFGGQGSPMLPIRYRIEGADLPSCVMHRTTLSYCSAYAEPDCQPLEETSLVTPLNTYSEADGSRTTKTLFVITGTPAEGMPIELEVQIGDAIANRTFYIGALPPDAGEPDSAAADANTTDADIVDSNPSDAATADAI
jgi:hypothetical protein